MYDKTIVKYSIHNERVVAIAQINRGEEYRNYYSLHRKCGKFRSYETFLKKKNSIVDQEKALLFYRNDIKRK